MRSAGSAWDDASCQRTQLAECRDVRDGERHDGGRAWADAQIGVVKMTQKYLEGRPVLLTDGRSGRLV